MYPNTTSVPPTNKAINRTTVRITVVELVKLFMFFLTCNFYGYINSGGLNCINEVSITTELNIVEAKKVDGLAVTIRFSVF
jgi:hypothetical protein